MHYRIGGKFYSKFTDIALISSAGAFLTSNTPLGIPLFGMCIALLIVLFLVSTINLCYYLWKYIPEDKLN